MSDMKVIYARITDLSHAYVASLAAQTGLSMSQIVEFVIGEARRRHWQIEIPDARISDTSGSPAVSAPTLPPAGSGPGSSPTPPLGTGEPGPPGEPA